MANPKVIFNDISEAMGTPSSKDLVAQEEDRQDLSVSTYEPRHVLQVTEVAQSKPIEEQDLLDDFTFSRKSQQMIIESAGMALQEAISAAIASGNPEGFTAVASLMAQINSANKNLLEIHRSAGKANQERNGLKEKPSVESKPSPEKSGGGDVFMTGTTSEMILLLKKLGKIPNEPVN